MSQDLISKLCNVEQRLEKTTEIEKVLYEKDMKIDELAKKVEEIEKDKDKLISLRKG